MEMERAGEREREMKKDDAKKQGRRLEWQGHPTDETKGRGFLLPGEDEPQAISGSVLSLL
jgi:hypothetical protein